MGHRRDERTDAPRVDRVAVTGAAIALAGGLLGPLAVFRVNRIVSGTPFSVWTGGFFAASIVVACLVALIAALRAPTSARDRVLLVAGATSVVSLAFALGRAVVVLRTGAAEFSRVSIGTGAWAIAAGGAIVWFSALRHDVPRAWRAAVHSLAAAGLVMAALAGGLSGLSIVSEYRAQTGTFWSTVATHLAVAGGSLALAMVIGLPLGVLSARVAWIRSLTLGLAGVIQTVPSLALLGLLVVPLSAIGLPGIGSLPAVMALTLYALLPIVRNTFVGLSHVDPAALDAGRGMGMDRRQLLFKVEAPLALPLVIEGIRAAAVMVTGIAAVVAFIGVGTLGVLVFQGWGQQADDLILLGALPMVVLAVLVDLGLRRLSRAVVSPGIRQEGA